MKSTIFGILIGLFSYIFISSPNAINWAISHWTIALAGLGLFVILFFQKRIKRRFIVGHKLNVIQKNIQFLGTTTIEYNNHPIILNVVDKYTIRIEYKDSLFKFWRFTLVSWGEQLRRKTEFGNAYCKINDAVLDQMVVLVSICADYIKNKMNQTIDEITSELKELKK